jgi:hypothetical protein
MSELGQSTAVSPTTPDEGFLTSFFGLYLSPGEAFPALLRKRQVWIPILAWIVLNLAFTAVWMHKVDVPEFVKAQVEENGGMDKVQPEQRQAIVDMQVKIVPIFAWVFAVLGPPLLVVIVGAVYLVVFRFFQAAQLDFVGSMTVFANAFFAMTLVTVPLTLAVLFLKGDWSVNPGEVLNANLTILFEKGAVSKAVWVLLHSLDLFTFWLLFLLVSGYRAATRRTGAGITAGVIAPWLIWTLILAGLAALRPA